MLSWGGFEKQAPEIAARGKALLGCGVAFIATTAADGAPRVHPATPLINGGRLFVFVAKHTAKYPNLLRDSRYAMHAVLGDSDEEFLIHGRALPDDDPASEELAWEAARAIDMTSVNHRLFEFFIDYAHWALWEGLGTDDIRRVSKTWREGPS
ncbi:MAG TPA: pyridoxamine 5'-phosphate oxidase family protein [Dehalococcoidia bacterium]|nr:pyridoxamine 5'-phosphate oxidase family protein [Dehalococcoidia bacterium]